MQEIKTTLGIEGTITLPIAYYQKLGVQPGDELILRLETGEIRILSPQSAIKRAQALIRQYVPEEQSLSDELIQERREQAQDE